MSKLNDYLESAEKKSVSVAGLIKAVHMLMKDLSTLNNTQHRSMDPSKVKNEVINAQFALRDILEFLENID